jgi:hypothetical protein
MLEIYIISGAKKGSFLPSVVRASRAYTGFPAADDFAITFTEDPIIIHCVRKTCNCKLQKNHIEDSPNPKVHIRVREPREHTRQTRRDDLHPHAFPKDLEGKLQRQIGR